MLIAGLFYFMVAMLDYKIVSINSYVFNTLFMAVIIWLTVKTLKEEHEKTKTTAVVFALLPFIAFFYLFFKSSITSTEAIDTHPYIHTLHACVTLICSMTVFYKCVSKKGVRIGLGIVYSGIVALIFMALAVSTFFSIFGIRAHIAVRQSALSPNGVYLAEVKSADQGALGGSTFVTVTRQNRDIDLFLITFVKAPRNIYTGRWSESLNLRWESDQALYINEQPYKIK
jgi:hypothetical protein